MSCEQKKKKKHHIDEAREAIGVILCVTQSNFH